MPTLPDFCPLQEVGSGVPGLQGLLGSCVWLGSRKAFVLPLPWFLLTMGRGHLSSGDSSGPKATQICWRELGAEQSVAHDTFLRGISCHFISRNVTVHWMIAWSGCLNRGGKPHLSLARELVYASGCKNHNLTGEAYRGKALHASEMERLMEGTCWEWHFHFPEA